MNGFKDGASADDPFADDSDDGDDANVSDAGTTAEADVTDTPTTNKTTTTPGGTEEQDAVGSDGLPWIYQRNSITDGRQKTVQLHLQKPSLREEQNARSDVEVLLDESVHKADLREAALLVGLRNLDEVADQLREWGYDIN